MPVKVWQTSARFWFFLSYLITTVRGSPWNIYPAEMRTSCFWDRMLKFGPEINFVTWTNSSNAGRKNSAVYGSKVRIFWEGYIQYIQTKVRWRFRKILWPSQNIWTFKKRMWSEKSRYFHRHFIVAFLCTILHCFFAAAWLVSSYKL